MSVTLDDIARHVGVSRALVSLALRDSPRVADSTRRVIQDAAAELGYRPNLLARHLASSTTATVGVVLTELHNPIFADIHDGLAEAAAELGYRTLLAAGSVDPRKEEEAVESLLDFRVGALALIGPSLPSRAIRALAARIPVVVVGGQTSGVDSVAVDDRQGTRLAVEHLIGLGHERIAHLDGGNGPGAAPRRAAYTELMERNGLGEHVQIAGGDYTEAGGEVAAESLIRAHPRPTAIFAANDLSAIGAMAVARRRGLEVPRQLSVVGFDDASIAAYGLVALTTIEQPRRKIGGVAMQLLARRLKTPDAPASQTLIEAALVIRATADAPPRAAVGRVTRTLGRRRLGRRSRASSQGILRVPRCALARSPCGP
jgi:DNA-binding LacI/PurR family transcriptional regulator